MRVAVAGLGGAATRGHLPALRQLGLERRFALVAAADPDAARRAALESDLRHIELFERVDTMLDAIEPDLLVVATEPRVHARLTALGLANGAHVVCEKPLTLTREDQQLVARACCERPELALVPVHQYRYSPGWMAISRWARRANRLGIPFTLAIEVERDGADGNAASPWRVDVASGGMLADHGVHFLALARTISDRIEVIEGRRKRDADARESCTATLQLGCGRLEMRVAADSAARHNQVELRLPSVKFRWHDESTVLIIGPRHVWHRQVAALSDRRHVDALYLPLYRELFDKLDDPSWRRCRTREALSVGSTLVSLLTLADRSPGPR